MYNMFTNLDFKMNYEGTLSNQPKKPKSNSPADTSMLQSAIQVGSYMAKTFLNAISPSKTQT
jgi:hypothetical protein